MTPPAAQSPAAEFAARGFTVVRGFFSAEEVDALLGQIQKTATGEATDDILSRGELRFVSNAFRRSTSVCDFISQPRLIELLTPILGKSIWVRWDQAVEKGPGAGEFPWHQDNGYSQALDQHVQLWVALTPGSRENGGLWVQPESRRTRLPHEARGNHVAWVGGEPPSPELVEAEPGDVVLFSSYTLHATRPNTSEDSRWAYVVEDMAGRHVDPSVAAPYFVVTRGGRRVARFESFHRGWLNPWSHARYALRAVETRLRSAVSRGLRLVLPR